MSWDFAGDLPIYAQLVTLLRQKIVAGEYPPGDKLPSVRELAAEAAVNPNTVQRALAELERSGLIVTQRTAGKFVTADEPAITAARKQLADEQICAFVSAMQALGYTRQEAAAMLEHAPDNLKEEENPHADPAM